MFSMLDSLDAASRQCLLRVCIRAGCYTAYATFCWFVLTGRSLAELAQLLHVTHTLGCLAACVVARRFGERMNAGPLNHWDEGALLYAISLAAHALLRISL
jgi:hypothetical protein